MCIFRVRAAGRREYERRAFVAHKLLLLQPQQVAVVRLGSLCSSSHTAKNFAFIFDIQAQVRLFLPCGSPCVRSTSDCAMLLRSRRTKDGGTAFSRFILQTPRMPFVACNELAIATKSIASVCPHAERTPWVPFQVGTTVWAALSNTYCECVVAKANEADCLANAKVQTREEGGASFFEININAKCCDLCRALQ